MRQKLPTRNKFTKIGININGECLFCNEEDEGINHLFSHREMAKAIWTNLNTYCHFPCTYDIPFVEWINIYGPISHGIIKPSIIL